MDYTRLSHIALFDGIDAHEIEHRFAWDGQNLTLTVVPEPAEFAAAFGALALFIAARRRR